MRAATPSRGSQVIDQLCALLQAPFTDFGGVGAYVRLADVGKRENELLQEHCRLAYRLLFHTMRDNSENQTYISRWFSFMQLQVGRAAVAS